MASVPRGLSSRNTLLSDEARKVARNLRVGWACTRVKLANDSASFRSRVGITPRRAGRRAHLSSSKGQTRREAGAQSHGPAVHPTIRAVGRLVAEGRAGENLSIPGATGNRRIVAPNSPVQSGVAGARSAILVSIMSAPPGCSIVAATMLVATRDCVFASGVICGRSGPLPVSRQSRVQALWWGEVLSLRTRPARMDALLLPVLRRHGYPAR
jgi:hypothetical protein